MAPPKPPPQPQLTQAGLLALIRAHGSSIMAYSKLQPGLEHFYVPDLGAVSFCVMQVGPPFLFKNRPAVLGDPLCAPEDRERLTRLFLQKHPRSFFVQVSRDYALLLQRVFGLKATCMGGETELDVAGGYDLSGQAKHPLRHAAAAAEREGVWVEELSTADGPEPKTNQTSSPSSLPSPPSRLESDEVQNGLRAVDAAWATTKGAHHAARIWFINRAPVFDAEPGVRKFVAWQQKKRGDENAATAAETATAGDREMVAYIFFDPVFKEGRLCGVYANVTRISPTAPAGCLNLIMREALKKFRRELEREAEEEKRKKNKAAAAGQNNDDDDLARDQDQQQPQQQQQKLTRKERLALKAAALAARGVSAEELRAQRAAKKQQEAAAASSAGKAKPQPQQQAPKPAASPSPTTTPNTTNLPPFFVSLGMAPFYALSGDGSDGGHHDPELPGERSATRVMGWVYEHGQTFYPYKAIAFSKTRYGGGLDEATWTFPRDRAAHWRPVYAASSLDAPTFVALFDLGALVGFWKGPFNAIATFVRYEWSGLKARVAARLRDSKKAGRSGGGKGAGDEAALAAFGAAAADAAPAAPPAAPVAAAPAAATPPPSPSFASAASAPGSVVDAVASVADEDELAAAAAAKGLAAPAALSLAPRAGVVA